MEPFQYIQVDLLEGDGNEPMDSFVVAYQELCSSEDMPSKAEMAVAEIRNRAEQLLLKGQSLRRIMYKDDEEDWCTLNADTLNDALCFITPCGDGLGQLQFRITVDQVSQPTEPPPEPPAPVEVQQFDFNPEPREAAHAKESEPEVEPLQVEPEPLPPPVCTAKTTAGPLEVHPRSTCGRCGKDIVGNLYKCLQCDDLDVCEACFNIICTEQDQELFVLKMSDDSRCVASSYYAAPTPASSYYAMPMHHGIRCIGCGIEPIIGTRYTGTDCPEQNNLCETCYRQVSQDPLLEPEPKKEVEEGVPDAQLEPDQVASMSTDEATVAMTEVTPASPPSAFVLKCADLELGTEALEDCAARGDATPEFAEIIAKAGVRQAVRLGRVAIMANENTPSVPVIAKCIVRNDGQVPWPETTALTFLFGEDFNFRHLPLGTINPGEVAEVVVDLQLPARSTPCTSSASWAFIDVVTGVPLGPVLLFEAVWFG